MTQTGGFETWFETGPYNTIDLWTTSPSSLAGRRRRCRPGNPSCNKIHLAKKMDARVKPRMTR
jgi:hypothetical protein